MSAVATKKTGGILGLISLFLVLSFQNVWAWGPEGHGIVGWIAESHLHPEVRSTIRREFNIKHLAGVAQWADEEKRRKLKPPVLHYTNIAPKSSRYIQSRDCPRRYCVTERIKEFEGILADPSRSMAQRARAFRFLVHLVADVHQPMHLGNRKDRGGNEISLMHHGRPTNLHKLWDSELIGGGRQSRRQKAHALASAITPDEIQEWTRSGVEDWTDESRALVLKYGYTLSLDARQEATMQYLEDGHRVVTQQLKRAGVRLAHLLNRALMPATP